LLELEQQLLELMIFEPQSLLFFEQLQLWMDQALVGCQI
jgi:hypothetical protein